MTPTGKGIVLAALDILAETKTLIKRDFDEAKKIIEQIPENDHSPEESTCTAEPTSSE
jgi:hypothetical protein